MANSCRLKVTDFARKALQTCVMNGSPASNETTLTILRNLAFCVNSFHVEVCVYEGTRKPYYRKFRVLGHIVGLN